MTAYPIQDPQAWEGIEDGSLSHGRWAGPFGTLLTIAVTSGLRVPADCIGCIWTAVGGGVSSNDTRSTTGSGWGGAVAGENGDGPRSEARSPGGINDGGNV